MQIRKTNAEKFLETLESRALIVYSNSSIANVKFNISKHCMLNIKNIGKNVKDIEDFILKHKDFDEIVAVGGGSVIDVAKQMAFKLNKHLTVIMSMLSTNAFSTNKSCLIVDGEKITLDAKEPDVLIFDEKLLSKAQEMNFWGLCDVLSIHTALFDWKIANQQIGELFTKYFDVAMKLLKKTERFIKKNYKNLENKLWKEFKLIRISGEITNKHGSGRPESGSEHIFAKLLEKEIPNLPHGLAVINGILIMSKLQNNIDVEIEQIAKLFDVAKWNEKYGITDDLLNKALKEVKPRTDRFTIIDLVKKEEEVG